MNTFHVVPRGDAMTHVTRGDACPCVTEIRTANSDSPEGFDKWVYHRDIPLAEAVFREPEESAV